MKTTVRVLMTIGLVGTLVSCKSTFNASETMDIEGNRDAVYQEIISNPSQFSEFIDQAQQDEGARKIMIQKHMEKMESGNMKMMMEKIPEMKDKMQSHMQMMMKENPKMMQGMQSKILGKMMESEKGRKMLMEKIHSNKMMKKEMRVKMMEMMEKSPEMMQKMMEKNPEMKEKMNHHKEGSKDHKHNKL